MPIQDEKEYYHEYYVKNRTRYLSNAKIWAESHPEKVSLAKLKYRLKGFGASVEWYNQSLQVQHGACAICEKKFGQDCYSYIDHNHANNELRGLLCRECNVGIALFNDDITMLAKAIEYLERGR